MSNSPEIITNITSYDVLADPALDGVMGEYQLENYTKNVGNNRLKVFLGLHQHEYDRASRQDDAMVCDTIVTNIIETLNKKCVPTGRFLINSVTTDNSMAQVQSSPMPQAPVWKLMEEYEAKQLIHAIFKGAKPPDSYLFQQQQVRMEPLNDSGMSPFSGGGTGSDDHKRRRRSSLLRRSASESLLDDTKKVFKFDQDQSRQNRRMSREEPIWSSSRRLNNNKIINLNRMDVILTSTMDALDPNCQSIGNNRLHILVAMQSGKYQQANDRQKESILDEVMQTVNSFWKGRFLTETMSGCYEELDNRDAKRSLRHIFDMRSGQSFLSQAAKPALNITPKVGSSGSNNDVEMSTSSGGNRTASTSAVLSSNNNSISNDTKKMLGRHMSSPTNPSFVPPVTVSGIDDLRSAAIKSLQKQKARQQVANRLEKVSMRNSQQQQQFHKQMHQPPTLNARTSLNSMNGMNSGMNGSFNNTSFSGNAKRRQSSIFGNLDPTIMDEIVDGCFDDED